MSDRHIYILRKAQIEYRMVRAAITYTTHYWHYQENSPVSDEEGLLSELAAMSRTQFEASVPEKTIEQIFLIRLFAVFEGIVKENHSLRHANDAVPLYASVSWYIDRVAYFNRRRISEKIVANVHAARKYRNALVHSLPNVSRIPFSDILADLSKFVIKLPDI